MKPFAFSKPINTTQAIAGKKNGTQFIAGGTNLVDLMKKHIADPDALLDITTAVSDRIQADSKSIRIGAMVRNTAITLHPEVLSKVPLIAKAVLAGASPQIRNMASTGGNLLQRTRCPYFYDTTLPCNKRSPGSGCGAKDGDNRMSAIIGWSEHCVAVHPSDLCVALAALDAVVWYTDPQQKTKSIPFKDFHRLPDNTPQKDNHLPENALITEIEITQNSFNKNYAYLKIRDRDSYAFALLSVAAALHLEGNTIKAARLASGGVAHKPWRWYEAEKFLEGKAATVDNFRKAAAIAAGTVKPLSHNGFKVEMLKGAVETALQNCLKA